VQSKTRFNRLRWRARRNLHPWRALRYIKDNTERPETIDIGSNILSGTDPVKILEAARVSYAKTKTWANPFGDGKTGLRITKILREKLN
jgi:UDP-N-acetylglucosamine 2-epimerase